jgi:hypothetical protein
MDVGGSCASYAGSGPGSVLSGVRDSHLEEMNMQKMMLAALLCAVATAAHAGDPNLKRSGDRSKTEAGVSDWRNKSSAQPRMRQDTSGTYRDNKGNTRGVKDGRVRDPR